MKISIEFGGFYDSWHSDLIIHNIESLQEFNQYESYNLHKLFDNFVKNGCSFDKARSKVIEKVTYEKNKYNSDNINWQETYQSYIESYCYYLESYILDEYNINIDFKNISLYSPREYNFRTDEIDCIVNEKQSLKLLKLVLKDTDFHKRLKEVTTSRSGYIPNYTYEQLLNMKDNMILDIMFSFIADEFNSDTCNLSDIEYEIKLIKQEKKVS